MTVGWGRPLTRAEARQRSSMLAVTGYEIELRLDSEGETFESDTKVRFTSETESTFIDLAAAELLGAELNGAGLDPHAHDGGRLTLDDLAAENVLRVRARFPYQSTGAGLHRMSDPDDGIYVHTHLQPFNAHRVFACFDQPDLKAPFTLEVSTPPDWLAVSSGRERTGGATDRHRFAPTAPIPTYAFALAAGPWHAEHIRHGDVDLGIWCRPSLAADLQTEELLDVTRRGMDFYEQLFAHPYAFDKYDQLFVPGFDFGAMENVACVMFSEDCLLRGRATGAERRSRAETVLHELAHMWVGNLVTMRWWDDLWLNESFASHLATRALARATAFPGAWVEVATERRAATLSQDRLPTTHPIAGDIADTDAVLTSFDAITYGKGAAALRQLASWVGEAAFDGAVRNHVGAHRFGNAEAADLISALETASGRRLGGWSRAWLETAGSSLLTPCFAAARGRYTRCGIEQRADPVQRTLRPHRTAVALFDWEGGRLRLRLAVEVEVTGARAELEQLVGEPVADLVLINPGDLTYARIGFDERSLETLLSRLSTLDEPITRAVGWSALWELTAGAELPSRRWLAAVHDHAGSEADAAILGWLLRQAITTVDLLTAPAHAAPARERLAAQAREWMNTVEAGGDAQLEWARCLATVGAGAGHAGELRSLLDGTTGPPGLIVDAELRWRIVTALAAAGEAGEAEIERELQRDPGDAGRHRAETARAARPQAAAKELAWSRAVQDDHLRPTTVQAILEGFHRSGQDELLAPYVERYLDALPAIWRQRPPEQALTLTRDLYPRFLVDGAIVAAAERAIGLGLPEGARRLLVEARARTVEAGRARALDASEVAPAR